MTTAKTTAATITDEQIEALRDEAATAGDKEMRRICLAALGDESWAEAIDLAVDVARAECARVIADVEAMEDLSQHGWQA